MERLELQAFGPDLLAPWDFVMSAGETVTLSGLSGSGKSLLLRAIADLDPHRGEAWLDGRACGQVSPRVWRRQVCYLAAESAWWSDRVADHFPPASNATSNSSERVMRTIELLGLPEDALDWPVDRLSSGERQRLAIARMLAIEPRVLLLDEPTANLDPENTRLVEQAITDYQTSSGSAVIWVTHDPAQQSRLNARDLRIEQGHIREYPS
jgi:ABC-type iron transport system FetAB ATPase subunit